MRDRGSDAPRDQWTEADAPALAQMSEADGKHLADQLRKMGFQTRKSRVGMIMVSVKDSFDTSFHLGEALACEAMVEYRDVTGWGLVLGGRERAAFIAACADAAKRVGDPDALDFIHRSLENLKQSYQARLKTEKALAKCTKVNFGLMVEG